MSILMPNDDPNSRLAWLLPGGVRLAYSTRDSGTMRDASARAAWLVGQGCTGDCVLTGQPHGAVVVDAQAAPAELALADGLVTRERGIAIGVFGADCPGVGIVAPDAIGLAHCGWRGTAQGIIRTLVAAMHRCSTQPVEQWHAFIGPGISGVCYEVDAAVMSARSWPLGAMIPGRPGHAFLDLGTALAQDLADAGIPVISRSVVCTFSDARLHSYRKHGPGGVQLLAAWRDPEGRRR